MDEFIDWWSAERLGVLIACLAALLAWGAAYRADQRAKDANKIAQQAIEEAQAANKLSLEANVTAKDANSIAIDANEIAKSVKEIQEIQAARDAERDDVVWDHEWGSDGDLFVYNNGQDPAFNVHVSFKIHDIQIVEDFEVIKAKGKVRLNGTYLYAKARNEVNIEAEQRARRSQAGFFGGARKPVVYDQRVRITWDTQLGKHSVYKPDDSLCPRENIIGAG